MDPTVRELVLLALLSAFLCGVALIYAEPIATAVFAALTSGCVVICCKALARLMDLKGSLASRSPSTDRRARRELTTTLEIGAHRGPLAAPQTAAGELRDALRWLGELVQQKQGFWRVRSAQLDQPSGGRGRRERASLSAVAMSALGERRHERGSWSGRV